MFSYAGVEGLHCSPSAVSRLGYWSGYCEQSNKGEYFLFCIPSCSSLILDYIFLVPKLFQYWTVMESIDQKNPPKNSNFSFTFCLYTMFILL